eukprot:m.476804 g.476804  ORF g.476804 m.476804 type:complete len:369 (+) comp20661_c0_seq1:1385-2491(+)
MAACRCVCVALVVALAVVSVHGHGAIVSPRSRNSIDYLANVNTQKCANITGAACNNGQAAFWYSQGCFIGCPTCDHMSGRRQTDLCGLGKKATLNDPKYRSVNRNATAGSPDDVYKHNPWRAPGSAPVANACGLAGGTPWGADVSEAGDYVNTTYAHHGMKGTDLPAMDTGVVWKRGTQAEVTWQIRNNHGGGYQYRLCPLSSPLTEECFQAHPLEFVQDKQAVVFPNGTLFPVAGTFVSEGVLPVGSTWAMMPMPPTWLGPRCLPGPNDTATTPYACQPWEHHNVDGPCTPCPQTPGSDCSRCDNNGTPAFEPPCQGCQGVDWNVHAVRDLLEVPSDIPSGKYVLGFRYDCEATAQVWSNCADIEIA